jgi:dolichyl-phosphate beta-glucosyltransferase
MSEDVAARGPDPSGAVPVPPGRGDVDITFFVACYNEEENIVDTLDMLTATMAEAGVSWEAIVIDDGSTDRSAELVRGFIREHPGVPVTLVVNEVNKGLAHSYTDAAFLGRGKYYRLICGDNVERKENILKLVKHLGEADMIIPVYRVTGRSLSRRLLSKAYTWLVNAITGYRIGYYNGLAIHLRYNVMRWHGYSRGFGFQADLIARLLDEGYTYKEVPVQTHERTKGKAKAIALKNFLSVGHTLLELLIRRVSRRMYGRGRARAAAARRLEDGGRRS